MGWLILATIVVVIVWFFARRHRHNQSLVETVETTNPNLWGRLRDGVPFWRNGTPTTLDPSQQLQTWAEQNLAGEPGLRTWLLSLNSEEMGLLAERLQAFCADLGVELSWLFDPRVQDNPEIKRVVEGTVVSFCSTVWHALQVRDDILAYQALLAFEKDPHRPKQREFGQRFYSELVVQGLVPTAPPDLVLASAADRDAYVLAAIREAAQQDGPAFKQVLHTVATTSLTPVTPA